MTTALGSACMNRPRTFGLSTYLINLSRRLSRGLYLEGTRVLASSALSGVSWTSQLSKPDWRTVLSWIDLVRALPHTVWRRGEPVLDRALSRGTLLRALCEYGPWTFLWSQEFQLHFNCFLVLPWMSMNYYLGDLWDLYILYPFVPQWRVPVE